MTQDPNVTYSPHRLQSTAGEQNAAPQGQVNSGDGIDASSQTGCKPAGAAPTPRNCPAHFAMREVPCPYGCGDLCIVADREAVNKRLHQLERENAALREQLAEARQALRQIEDHHNETEEWREIARNALKAIRALIDQPGHPQTDRCGFDRNASHSNGTYTCTCGWIDQPAKSDDARDAERYRHLRNTFASKEAAKLFAEPSPILIDAAIDAAMEKGG